MSESFAVDSTVVRKARGAFFTPAELCRAVANWAIRSATDAVLEPSCGEAAFLLAADARLRELGSETPRLHGHEVHAASATAALALLDQAGAAADVHVGDFLTTPADPRFAAVIGNPPYIRFQAFTGEARAAGAQAAWAQGVRLTGLASSWAPFVIHATACLRPGGRLGFVLPAELLSSNYAADIRAFLMANFGSITIVEFDGLAFRGVQTEALVLLADERGGSTGTITFSQGEVFDGTGSPSLRALLAPHRPTDKWTRSRLTGPTADTVDTLAADGLFSTLGEWGRVSLGAVTGNNAYFALSATRAAELHLAASDVVRLSPPGSTHLRSLTVSRGDYQRLTASDKRTLLFRPEEPSPAARAYILRGEEHGVDQAYKCRVRAPWWRVPLQAPADLLFTYMNAHTPQLASNPLHLRHLNSVHGVYLPAERRGAAGHLALACLNSATMLSAETVGRAYGGGVLKMEPREATCLAVPSSRVLSALEETLEKLRRPVRTLLRSGQLPTAVALVDEAILGGGCGLTPEAISALRRDRNVMAHRRINRGRRTSTTAQAPTTAQA